MVKSMTAFAAKQVQEEIGVIRWEVRSVNSRHLDMNFHLPEAFREIEPVLRAAVADHLKRGKVDCALRYQAGVAADYAINVNQALTKKIHEAVGQIKNIFQEEKHVNLLEVLRWPGVMQMVEGDLSVVQKVVLDQFNETLKELNQSREREGEKLGVFIGERLQLMKVEIKKAQTVLPEILKAQKQRMVDRFAEINLDFDKTRLEQEMVFWAQKMDVSEELDRLNMHINEVERILSAKEAIGRRLDFLMQELNREANTLGSKSMSETTTHVSVELKVLIEQMREQVQNIE